MNIKRPFLIIIPLLLLILLLFFICSDRGALFKDESSVSSISDTGGIGYMREITPGDEMDDPTGESPDIGSTKDISAADSQQRSSREESVRKPAGASIRTDNAVSVKPAAEKRIIPKERETVPEKSRVFDTEAAARKDDSEAKEDELKEKRTEIYAAAEKRDAAEKTLSADKKIEAAAVKSEVVPDDKKREITKVIADKSETGDLKYNRLDRIHLYSGEVLTGAVTVRGDIYTIVTPDGIRRIASRDIQGNDIVK